MRQVLVLDGRQRSALAATRSLGGHGLEIHVADASKAMLAATSRYARSRLQYPDPQTCPDEFVDWVLTRVRDMGIQAVLPLTDLTTMLLAPRAAELEPAKLLCAPAQAYEAVSDKARLVELARELDVQVPLTTTIRSLDQLESQLHECSFPVVLKPARSKVRIGNSILSTNVLIAHSYRDAVDYLSQQRWLDVMPCLVQQYIEGQGSGIFACFADGKPVAWFCHRRVREKPPSGGVSVLSESAEIDRTLRDSANRILTTVGWSGAAMVEYKIATNGVPYLMEINGRLWGSLQLAIDAGIDFPWLLYQHARGASIDATPKYDVGCRLQWLLGDFDNLLIRMRDSRLTAKEKLGAAAAFVRTPFDPTCRQEIFRWQDVAPAIFELKEWIKDLA